MTPPRPPRDTNLDPQPSVPGNLPLPSIEAQQVSDRLLNHLRKQIAHHGPLRFDNFMQGALYAPGLGYYTNGSDKFGAAGDFVTAPEISSLFATCLATLARTVMENGAGDILEAGGGQGTLAAGLLQALETDGALPEHYYMLEISPELRARQQQVLQQAVPHLLPRIQWLDKLPEQFNGLVLANELLDALPVRRFHVRDGQLDEQYVDWCDGLLCYRDRPIEDARLRERIESLHLKGDYLSEVNFRAEDWTKTMGEHLQRGVLLIIDYGFPRREYYHPQRNQGTLMCHYQHHSHPDPLILAGLQDITAHVDFTAIADAALATQLDVSGYTTQAHFLLDSGILNALQSDVASSPSRHLKLANEVKRLTLPQEMGEIFKVMALTRQWDTMLPGFQQHDLRSHL